MVSWLEPFEEKDVLVCLSTTKQNLEAPLRFILTWYFMDCNPRPQMRREQHSASAIYAHHTWLSRLGSGWQGIEKMTMVLFHTGTWFSKDWLYKHPCNDKGIYLMITIFKHVHMTASLSKLPFEVLGQCVLGGNELKTENNK